MWDEYAWIVVVGAGLLLARLRVLALRPARVNCRLLMSAPHLENTCSWQPSCNASHRQEYPQSYV